MRSILALLSVGVKNLPSPKRESHQHQRKYQCPEQTQGTTLVMFQQLNVTALRTTNMNCNAVDEYG